MAPDSFEVYLRYVATVAILGISNILLRSL